MLEIPQKKTMNIQLRVTKNQYKRIKNNAEAKGYTTVAQFMRFLALDKDMIFEMKFNEIYENIVKKKTISRKKVKRHDFLI